MHVDNFLFTRYYFKAFFAAISDKPIKVFLCSPFIHRLPFPEYPSIYPFTNYLYSLGVQQIDIVTREPNSDEASISLSEARLLDSNSVNLYFRKKPLLHAKLYYFEYYFGNFIAFIGSSNFTLGGFERNHELMAEISGVSNRTSCHREMERLKGPGSTSFNEWLKLNQQIE